MSNGEEESVWGKRINTKIQELIEEKIYILRKDYLKHDNHENSRPYVNSVTIKLKAKEIISLKKKRKEDYIQ